MTDTMRGHILSVSIGTRGVRRLVQSREFASSSHVLALLLHVASP